jgi:hypothetical protein
VSPKFDVPGGTTCQTEPVVVLEVLSASCERTNGTQTIFDRVPDADLLLSPHRIVASAGAGGGVTYRIEGMRFLRMPRYEDTYRIRLSCDGLVGEPSSPFLVWDPRNPTAGRLENWEFSVLLIALFVLFLGVGNSKHLRPGLLVLTGAFFAALLITLALDSESFTMDEPYLLVIAVMATANAAAGLCVTMWVAWRVWGARGAAARRIGIARGFGWGLGKGGAGSGSFGTCCCAERDNGSDPAADDGGAGGGSGGDADNRDVELGAMTRQQLQLRQQQRLDRHRRGQGDDDNGDVDDPRYVVARLVLLEASRYRAATARGEPGWVTRKTEAARLQCHERAEAYSRRKDGGGAMLPKMILAFRFWWWRKLAGIVGVPLAEDARVLDTQRVDIRLPVRVLVTVATSLYIVALLIVLSQVLVSRFGARLVESRNAVAEALNSAGSPPLAGIDLTAIPEQFHAQIERAIANAATQQIEAAVSSRVSDGSCLAGTMLDRFLPLVGVIAGAQTGSTVSLAVRSMVGEDGIESLDAFVGSLRRAVVASVAVGSTVATLFVVIMWWLMLAEFRENLMRIRVGLVNIAPLRRQYSMVSASTYVGLQVGHIAVGWIVLASLTTLVTFLLAWSEVRNYLISYLQLSILSKLLGPLFVINLVITLLASYAFSDDRWALTHPRAFLMCDYALLYLTLLTGAARAIAGFFVTLAGVLAVYVRLDRPLSTSRPVAASDLLGEGAHKARSAEKQKIRARSRIIQDADGPDSVKPTTAQEPVGLSRDVDAEAGRVYGDGSNDEPAVTNDAGFRAYMSVLLSEEVWGNPLAQVWIELVEAASFESRIAKTSAGVAVSPAPSAAGETSLTSTESPAKEEESDMHAQRQRQRSRRTIRNRLWLWITLARNPSLRRERRVRAAVEATGTTVTGMSPTSTAAVRHDSTQL